jgi:hypothetical protein
MIMNCEKCNTELLEDETHNAAGKTLCEDCYLDSLTVTKTCDPWAVYTATRTKDQQPFLTPLQEKILTLLRAKGPLPPAAICLELQVTENELQQNFVSLRHMELARACKQDNQICYTLF